MYISEIQNIKDLYRGLREEDIYDNPDTVVCNECYIEKPITKEHWSPSVIKYILSDKTYYPYVCRKCKSILNKVRNKRVKKATPVWANLDKIKEIYINCPKGSEVDHIIPLNGAIVSGLHVETNLQYLPMIANRKKSNSYKSSQGHTDIKII